MEGKRELLIRGLKDLTKKTENGEFDEQQIDLLIKFVNKVGTSKVKKVSIPLNPIIYEKYSSSKREELRNFERKIMLTQTPKEDSER